MSAVAPEETVWNLLRGALASRALAIVADLRVADALGAGPRPVDELAAENGSDPDTLHRLLRALASDGVFAEDEPRVFRNTEASELLRGGGWSDFAHLFGGIWLRAVGALDASGSPTFPASHGTDFWSWLAQNPEERTAFDRAMTQGADDRLARLDSVDWDDGELVVVDVGGGNGSLLLCLLDRHPQLRGVVFDLPETVREESAFSERCTFVAGDFFAHVPHGDAYVLSTILHDWDDEHAAAILRTVHAAARPGTRLVLLERVVQSGNHVQGAKWLDLLMLSLFAGRERDEAQWRALLDGNGWAPTRVEDGLIEARCR